MEGLPERTEDAEDRFVLELGDRDDLDEIIERVGHAIDARRPRLAGRLFQLVDDRIDPEPGSPLDRAARAARMFLVNRSRPEDVSWSELEDAWRDARRARMRRIKQRQRDHLAGVRRRIGRLDRRRR